MRINEWTKIRKKGSKLKKNETELKEMSVTYMLEGTRILKWENEAC
jgi:hypothetical protein